MVKIKEIIIIQGWENSKYHKRNLTKCPKVTPDTIKSVICPMACAYANTNSTVQLYDSLAARNFARLTQKMLK